MPLYEYECDACHRRFEVIQKFSDPHIETCQVCQKGPVRRLLSTPAIHFKGSGWYITDYAQKGKPAGESTGSEAGADKGEAKKTDAPDAKAPAASSGDTAKTSGAAPTPSTPPKA
jgi:putative FmdB family regulatory protein